MNLTEFKVIDQVQAVNDLLFDNIAILSKIPANFWQTTIKFGANLPNFEPTTSKLGAKF